MTSAARKSTLPQFTLTEVADGPGENTTRVDIPDTNGRVFTYYTVPMLDSTTGSRRDGRPRWVAGTFPLYPEVLSADGSPWVEANLWVIDMLEAKSSPNMYTFGNIADDLAAYRRYLDEENIDWLHFSSHKLRRPTYRYNGFLKHSVEAGELSSTLAKRRMGTVIRFYRWLMSEASFKPAHAPWVSSDRYIEWKDGLGFSGVVVVQTTDVSIKDAPLIDPFSERIQDGGLLRPLPQAEQDVLLQVLAELGNTEMSLIHLFALLTGARIQTVLTTRVGHFVEPPDSIVGGDFRLRAGPGTGIDTKGGTKGILHLPTWFYERLYIYAHSERARKRRQRAVGGDQPDQLLFLSKQGAAFYDTRARRAPIGVGPQVRRRANNGQPVRQFIKDYLLPEMQRRLRNPRYEFSFHDLRATFGMNQVDSMTSRKIPYTRALDQLRQLMWHTRLSVTENYLKYRETLALFDTVQDEWNEHLTNLAQRVFSEEASHDPQD